MAQQRRIAQNKVSKREQERIEKRKAQEKTSFPVIAMRVVIILSLAAMVIGLAIQIVAYN